MTIKVVKMLVNSTDIWTKFHCNSVAIAKLYPQYDFHKATQYIYSKTHAKSTELKQTSCSHNWRNQYDCYRAQSSVITQSGLAMLAVDIPNVILLLHWQLF